jgi:hypothetical protein
MEELSGEREVHKREKKKQWKREKSQKTLRSESLNTDKKI